MPRKGSYNVPSIIIADQGSKLVELHKSDSQENKTKLESVGLKAEKFAAIAVLSEKLADLEQAQEERKAEAGVERAEVSQAILDAIEWRQEEVLTRAKLVFGDDPRIGFFRTGALRSRRASAVDRELRLLVEAIRDFADLPEAKEIGLNADLAARGQELLENLRKQDLESVKANTERSAATAALREVEDELSSLLADVEQRAAVVFKRGSAELHRYRMNEIRNYVATQHHAGKDTIDPTASVTVDDPDPGSAAGE